MNQMNQSLVIWGCILIVGVPIVTIILGQLRDSLRRREHPLAPFVSNLQRFVFPPSIVWLILQNILGIQEEAGVSLQILETCLGIAIIYTSLCLLKATLIPGKKEYTWQITVPNLLFQVVRAALVLSIVGYMLANIWKIDLSKAAQALGVGSLVIALALQDTLSNLVSGFLLLVDSPFKKGDWIKIGDLTGKVIDINWRAVRLITWDEDLLVIPNGSLGKQNILNYSQPTPTSGINFTVSFSRNDPPNRVKQVLQEVYEQITGTVGAPYILTQSFDDFSISYLVWFYGKDFYPKFEAADEFKTRLYYAAKRKGLSIPYPIEYQYVTDVTKGDKQQDILENKQKLELGDYLQSLPYFSSVTSDAISKLVKDTTVEYYGIGEDIIQEGKVVTGFYIIQNGNVQLSMKDAKGREQKVSQIYTDNFFGESVFMSGKPSVVSVKALSDLKLIKIEANTASNLFLANPRFAKQIDEYLSERRAVVERIQKHR